MSEEINVATLSIAGVPISEYTIVYKISPHTPALRDEYTKKLYPVYDFDLESADRLAALIKKYCGAELGVYSDSDRKETAHEILIGKTSRDATDALGLKNLASDNYVFEVKDGKLVICGGEFGATWHALDAFEALLKQSAAVDLAEGYNLNGEYHLTRIGCIGDSLTEGVGRSSESFTYSAQLGRFLWKDALVYNFGASGATMRSDFIDSYMDNPHYKDALAMAEEIDIYTIMLGSNDSHRKEAYRLDPNFKDFYGQSAWNETDDRIYVDDCKALMASLQAKNPYVRFVIGNCPASYENPTFPVAFFAGQWVRDLQEAMIPELNEAGFPTTFFDMYSVTKNLGENYLDWYTADGLHLNDTGYLNMAIAWKDSLAALISSVNQAE